MGGAHTLNTKHGSGVAGYYQGRESQGVQTQICQKVQQDRTTCLGRSDTSEV